MPKNPNPVVRPFLKWAGGKRQLLPEILARLPKRYGTYYEPFLGGAAVLLSLQPPRAVVNDTNAELINCYQVVRDCVDDLIESLAEHQAHNTAEYYYAVRDWDRDDRYCQRPPLERAARIIYLNKTCYNGLFRVNAQGQFNVPFGKYAKPNIVDAAVLRAVSHYLNDACVEFRTVDFAEATEDASRGDLVYCDPPYDPVSDTASFTGYDINGFDRKEQERLKRHLDCLTERGCKVMLSNASTPFITALYQGSYECVTIQATRAINSDGRKRGKVDELLVMKYGRRQVAKRHRVGASLPPVPDTRTGATLWSLRD